MKYTRTTSVIALILGGTLLAAQGAQATTPSPAAGSPPCTARSISTHEGYQANADGDTVDSQVDAFKIGSNIADSDLWVTSDGYLVQMHDDDVSHSTNGTGLVTDMTLAQVEALHTKYHDEPIPTLQDSLMIPRAHQAGRLLMFETKFSFNHEAAIQTLANQITAAQMTDHVIIYSVYTSQLNALKAINPAIKVWFKATAVPPISQVQGFDGIMLPGADITSDVVAEFHAAGIQVIRERQVESPDEWQQFVATGADGLMTDFPLTMIGWCRALG